MIYSSRVGAKTLLLLAIFTFLSEVTDQNFLECLEVQFLGPVQQIKKHVIFHKMGGLVSYPRSLEINPVLTRR